MNFKKLSYLFFVSLLGLLMISCSAEDSSTPSIAPSASFDVTADELVATFNNTSENAVSYIWVFGDGNKSTEENPVHTFAEEGTYDVELFATNSSNQTKTAKRSVTVSLKKEDENPMPEVNITLDGKFDDWAEIDEKHLAIAVLDEKNSDYKRLKEVRFIADQTYIYMYMKMDILHANAMDMYLNVDGDTETGYNSWMWKEGAANYLMQSSISSGYDMRLAAYDETKGGGWGWLSPNVVEPGMGLMTISEMVQVEGNIYEFEAQIMRNMIPNLGDSVKIMIGHSGAEGEGNEWATSGGLPTVTASGDKNEGLTVRLR